MNRLILLASILICVGCNSSEPVVLVFDLPAIAGKTPDEVVEILGKPDRIEETLNRGEKGSQRGKGVILLFLATVFF